MGVAAYNRGSMLIRRQINDAARPVQFAMMDELNSLPKLPGAQTPFAPVRFVAGHGGWWIECPTTGRGFWYRSLRRAVQSWNVAITGWSDDENGTWTAIPLLS